MGDSSLESSQPTHSTPNDTPESSNPAPIHQGVGLVLPNAPILYYPPASGPSSQENSNEDNAMNCEAAETSSLGQCTGDFGGGGGILENGIPFDLCARPQPEREIGRYYHYNPEDRSFVNYTQENFRLSCPRESQPAAPAASSSDDTPKPRPPPPPAPKMKPSASKERSKPAKRRKTVTRSKPGRRFSTIAPRPAVQNTPTATNRSHMPPPPPAPPIAVLGTPRPLNGYSSGYDTRGSVSTQVQFNHGTMNGNMPNNMGHPSMPSNAPFVNGNGNSMYHGTIPQGPLHSVQNHFNDQDINNVNIHRPATPIPGNVNGLYDGYLNSPNAFAPYHPADASRQHDMTSGGDFVPSSCDSERTRRRVRDMGTVNVVRHDSFSTGGNAAGLYDTSSPSNNPWRHIDRRVPISERTVPPGAIGWAARVPTSTDSPMGNTMGGFSQSSDPGSSPMNSMGGASYTTMPGSSPISHMSSSPPDPESMSRREVNGRRGSSSMTLNDLPGANNTV